MGPSGPPDHTWIGGDPVFRILDPENPEKLHMTYQIKALKKLVNVVKLEIWISGFWLGEKLEKPEESGKKIM